MQIHLVNKFRWWKNGLFMSQVVVFLFKLCHKDILLSFVGHRLNITWKFSQRALIVLHGSSLWLVAQSSLASPIQMLGIHFPVELQSSLSGMHPHLWPELHNIETRHIHLSCLFFHHLHSTFQCTLDLYNKVLCLNNTFHPTNHHMNLPPSIPPIVLCTHPSNLHNHHQTGNSHIGTYHLDTDIRSHPNYHHSRSHHRIHVMMAHRTLVKVWNLINL